MGATEMAAMVEEEAMVVEVDSEEAEAFEVVSEAGVDTNNGGETIRRADNAKNGVRGKHAVEKATRNSDKFVFANAKIPFAFSAMIYSS